VTVVSSCNIQRDVRLRVIKTTATRRELALGRRRKQLGIGQFCDRRVRDEQRHAVVRIVLRRYPPNALSELAEGLRRAGRVDRLSESRSQVALAGTNRASLTNHGRTTRPRSGLLL